MYISIKYTTGVLSDKAGFKRSGRGREQSRGPGEGVSNQEVRERAGTFIEIDSLVSY